MKPPSIVVLLVLFLLIVIPVSAVPVPASAGHNITFVNNCNRQVGLVFDEAIYDQSHPALKSCKPRQTDPPLCYTGEQCGATDCCPSLNETHDEVYNCPGIKHRGDDCQNATPYKSGYQNASLHKSPVTDCVGPVLGPSVNGSIMLNAGASRTITVPQYWNGAFFTRSDCTFDSDGYGSCLTGDCTKYGWGYRECAGAPSIPPATKGEFNFDLPSLTGKDWYDVSYVNGFNIGMVIEATRFDPAYPGSDPVTADRQCTASGCAVGLFDFASPEVPSWDVLKYPSTSNFLAINDNCDIYVSYRGTGSWNQDIEDGYCCPAAKGYVNDPSHCSDPGVGTPCRTCAGQNTSMYPFTLSDALPNSAKIFYRTCPKAYAYTYNDSDVQYTCKGNVSFPSAYTVTLTCPGPRLLTVPQQTPVPSSGSSTGEEPGTAALLSPGSTGGETLDFIFNDFSPSGGSSAISDTTVHHIHVSPTNATGETLLRVTKNPGLGTIPVLEGHAFSIYYRLELPNLPSSQVGSAIIEFSVKEKTLTSLGLKPEDVVLMHWDGTRWVELPTAYDYSTGGRAYFTATTPGFSYFAVTNRAGAQITPASTTLPPAVLPSMNTVREIGTTDPVSRDTIPATKPVAAPLTTPAPVNQSPAPQPAAMPGFSVLAAGVVVAGCCIIGGGWYARRWWIRRQNPALFDDMD